MHPFRPFDSLRARFCGELLTRVSRRWLLLICFVCGFEAEAATRQFQLQAGWNAIYLDIDPGGVAVDEAFDGQLVDAVARYLLPATQVRFIESADEEPWNDAGWLVWYAPQRAEAFLTTLHAVYGGAAYLVHAVKTGTLTVEGEIQPTPAKWVAGAFNLTGFAVETTGITFAQYFAGAEGRIGSRVYRMQNGSWQKVTNLAGTQIKPGEACWVHCEGSTAYPGPLEVSLSGGGAVNFSENSLVSVVELRNRINSSFSVQAALESNEGLPLFRQVIDLAGLAAESKPFSGAVPLGTLASGETTHLRFELRPELYSGSGRAATLKFTTSNGVVVRLPVHYRPK